MFGKNRRYIAELERQAADRQFLASKPPAVVLDIVDNGEQGWKWLVWDHDPDQTRLLAGGVEGVVVPHGMESGCENMAQARTRGIAAIRRSGWTGDIVLREPSPDVEYEPLPFSESKRGSNGTS